MIKIPNYTIESELGQGGMAKVYLAKQDMLHRYVALKVMFQDLAGDKNFRKSFLSEGSTIANLEHTNIVRIHDIGITEDSVFYMAMEHLSGGSLKDKLEQGKLSYLSVVNILQEVAKGLAYAHKKGYIHRDIKPGNILFREDGVAVLTDFGIAKLQDTTGELTRMGYTMGTVQYMSPEQAITTDLDQRSDIYSLGLVFYEMLTGAKAFLAESTIQAIHQHTTVPPPKLPAEYAFLQHVLDKVLAKDPNDRYQTVNDFVRVVKDADQANKTIIRRVHREEDMEVTRVYAPNKKPTESKRKSSRKTIIAGLIIFLAVGGFGVSKYLGLLDGSGGFLTELKNTVTDKFNNQQVDHENSSKQMVEEESVAQQKRKEEILIRQKNEEEKLAQQKAEKERLVKQKIEEERLTKQRAEEERLAKQKIEEERLAQQKAEEEKLAKEKAEKVKLAKKKAEKEKLVKEKAKRIAKQKAKRKAEEKLIKQAKLAKQKKKAPTKKEITKRQKELARIKAAKEKKRRQDVARALGKKKAEAVRRKQQYGQNQVQVAVTLNGRPYKATIQVIKNGKQIKLLTNRSFANIQLPSGRYTITTRYGGKPSRQVVNLTGNEIAQLRFAFTGSAPAPANSNWTHTHKPQNKPRPQQKPPAKKESKADRMVKEVEELWFDR